MAEGPGNLQKHRGKYGVKKREVLRPSVSRGWAQVPEWRWWPPGSGQGSSSSPVIILGVAGVGRKGCVSAWSLGPEATSCKGSSPDLTQIHPVPASPTVLPSARCPLPEGGGGASLVLTLNWGGEGGRRGGKMEPAFRSGGRGSPGGTWEGLFVSIKGKSEKEVWYTNWGSLYTGYPPWPGCLKYIQGRVWGLPILTSFKHMEREQW